MQSALTGSLSLFAQDPGPLEAVVAPSDPGVSPGTVGGVPWEPVSLMVERLSLLRMAAFDLHSRTQALIRSLDSDGPALTARERDVLLWLARGSRPEAIAHRLGIRRVTVDMHLSRARRKLQAATPTQAVARAISAGLIEP